MNAWWKIQSGRINALSLRERFFLFVTLIICLLALADTLWISPTQTAYRQTTLKLSTQNEELQRLRAELGSLYSNGAATANDPSKILQNDIGTAKERLQVLDQEINALVQRVQKARSIEPALIEFLRRQEGLTLLGTSTLVGADPVAEQAGLFKRVVDTVTSGAIIPVAPNALAMPSTQATGLHLPTMLKRGLELRVRGSYHHLSRYILTLEQALPDLRWGNLEIKIPAAPAEETEGAAVLIPTKTEKPELSLQVYVVGVSP